LKFADENFKIKHTGPGDQLSWNFILDPAKRNPYDLIVTFDLDIV